MLKHNLLFQTACPGIAIPLHGTTTMIAPARPPKKPLRSPVVERARDLLTATFWPPQPERASKTVYTRRWKAWAFGGVLIAMAIWLVYLVVSAMR